MILCGLLLINEPKLERCCDLAADAELTQCAEYNVKKHDPISDDQRD